MRRGLSIVVLSAVLQVAAHAAPPAEAANPHLGEALRDIEQGKLDAAKKALRAAMAYPENSNRILVEIYRNLAVVYLYTGEENKAYEAFARLLNIEPDYALPASSASQVKELFARVKKAYADGMLKPVRIAFEPPSKVDSNVPVTLTATISNMQDGFTARVLFRPAGVKHYHEIKMTERPGNRFVASLPPVSVRAPATQRQVAYYLEVDDKEGRRAQGTGNALEPLSFTVAAPPPPAKPGPPPWYKNGWIWAGVGVVVVGATAAVIISTRGPSTGTLPVHVRVP